MAPVRPSARRLQTQNTSDQGQTHSGPSNDPNVNNELFIDPMLGTPLAVYIEKDVEEKDELVRLVTVCCLIYRVASIEETSGYASSLSLLLASVLRSVVVKPQPY
jgi:hypothetical protein